MHKDGVEYPETDEQWHEMTYETMQDINPKYDRMWLYYDIEKEQAEKYLDLRLSAFKDNKEDISAFDDAVPEEKTLMFG